LKAASAAVASIVSARESALPPGSSAGVASHAAVRARAANHRLIVRTSVVGDGGRRGPQTPVAAREYSETVSVV
jgi:hypothetical protein